MSVEQERDSFQQEAINVRAHLCDAVRRAEKAERLIEGLLNELFVNWRTIPDNQITDVESAARELVLRAKLGLSA